MIELEFNGLASHPGSTLCECLSAAGIDAAVGARPRPADTETETSPHWRDATRLAGDM